MNSISVVEYDARWPVVFAGLRDRVAEVLEGVAISIEHVGSTAVPGLAAKPVIDMSVVVAAPSDVAIAIERLATLGYRHRGNLGVDGREAFHAPAGLPAHHMYVCPRGSLGLRNHLAVRDYLRSHPDAAETYGRLKQDLAARFSDDIESYIDGKTDFLLSVLDRIDLTDEERESIERSNRKSDR